jgi:hypothetical protein
MIFFQHTGLSLPRCGVNSLGPRNFSISSEDLSLAISILCQFFGTTSIPESSDTLLSKSRHNENVICFLKCCKKIKFIDVDIVSGAASLVRHAFRSITITSTVNVMSHLDKSLDRLLILYIYLTITIEGKVLLPSSS